jgi:uncharacterized protein YgfB (UPF0149 family)
MTYPELQAALEGLDSAVGAAEAHGWLCGALCARADYGARDWLGDLTDTVARGAPDATLEAVHARTLDALRSPDFTFEPLLPGDETALAERVAALASWCGGFLYGIGTGMGGRSAAKLGDVGEFLEDLAAITRAELGPGRRGDSDEGDFTELVEFVRAGTQLAWDEMAGLRAAAPRAGAAIH